MLPTLKTNLANLTASERKVADFILQNPTEVSYLTVQELAKQASVSTATIMRLTAKLGVSGYAEFQSNLQTFLKNDNTPKTRLQNTLAVSDDKLWGATLHHFASQLANLATTDEASLKQAVDALTGADKILTTAVRSGQPVAIFLAQNLNRIGGNSQFVQADLSDSVDDVLSLNDKSVLIAVSFPRYARRIYELTKVAKQKGATVIVLTDSYTAPLVDNSDIALVSDAKSLSFHNSPMMAMVVAEYLVQAIAKKHANHAKTRLSEVEEILQNISYHS